MIKLLPSVAGLLLLLAPLAACADADATNAPAPAAAPAPAPESAPASDPGPLVVTPAANWTVQYKKDEKTESYTVVPPAGNTTLLAFSRWPAPGTADQIPSFLDQMARRFGEMALHNPDIKLASTDYTNGEFIGDPFSGKYVEFTIKGGLKQVLFMFSDGPVIWNGQYIGTADGWNDAMAVLKSIKKAPAAP